MKKLLFLPLFLLFSLTVSAQVNLTTLGRLTYPNQTCAGVWHYVDSIGNEYALVGASDRVSIVDVSNPANPVEVFTVPALPGEESLWREIKTWGKYAYAGSEGGGGIIIIDLSNLPASINFKHWYGDGPIAGQLNTSHTVAATDGYLYVFGAVPLFNGGAIIADLADPWNPVYVGNYDLNYIHDGYIRNDTLWAGEIYAGQFSVIDVSNKSNPVLLATQQTPGQFTHNVWLSDNSQYAFTTDELNNEPMASFDVSDLGNIRLLDEYFTDSMPTQEVHNVRVLNDYLINPSYGSQITICDGHRPSNIIEVANSPTSTYLCWDASPYLPSGRIIATDVDSGLYIYEPVYQRASYLEGVITDSITGLPLNNVKVLLQPTDRIKTSNLLGQYKTGTATAGTYSATFRKGGYRSEEVQGINLTAGNVTVLDIDLATFIFTGTVIDSISGNPLSGIQIFASDGDNTNLGTTGANGDFTLNGLSSGWIELIVTKWGYRSICRTIWVDGLNPVVVKMQPGYSDNFITDLGWTVQSTATTGIWERGIPVQTVWANTIANPGADAADDCGDKAYVTGNGGGGFSDDDVDNGYTLLVSPPIDLSTYADPYLIYDRWFFIQTTTPAASSDTMFIKLTNGIDTVTVEYTTKGSSGNSSWVSASHRISNYLNPGPGIQVLVYIEDKPATPTALEGGFDNFSITEGTQSITELVSGSGMLQIYPNPTSGAFQVEIAGQTKDLLYTVQVMDYTGRVVYSQMLGAGRHLLSSTDGLPAGVYLVSLAGSDRIETRLKVLKIR